MTAVQTLVCDSVACVLLTGWSCEALVTVMVCTCAFVDGDWCSIPLSSHSSFAIEEESIISKVRPNTKPSQPRANSRALVWQLELALMTTERYKSSYNGEVRAGGTDRNATTLTHALTRSPSLAQSQTPMSADEFRKHRLKHLKEIEVARLCQHPLRRHSPTTVHLHLAALSPHSFVVIVIVSPAVHADVAEHSEQADGLRGRVRLCLGHASQTARHYRHHHRHHYPHHHRHHYRHHHRHRYTHNLCIITTR